jgi:hypothetical protein
VCVQSPAKWRRPAYSRCTQTCAATARPAVTHSEAHAYIHAYIHTSTEGRRASWSGGVGHGTDRYHATRRSTLVSSAVHDQAGRRSIAARTTAHRRRSLRCSAPQQTSWPSRFPPQKGTAARWTRGVACPRELTPPSLLGHPRAGGSVASAAGELHGSSSGAQSHMGRSTPPPACDLDCASDRRPNYWHQACRSSGGSSSSDCRSRQNLVTRASSTRRWPRTISLVSQACGASTRSPCPAGARSEPSLI